jgi:hypothetical protein
MEKRTPRPSASSRLSVRSRTKLRVRLFRNDWRGIAEALYRAKQENCNRVIAEAA